MEQKHRKSSLESAAGKGNATGHSRFAVVVVAGFAVIAMAFAPPTPAPVVVAAPTGQYGGGGNTGNDVSTIG
ncbi:hypothetical protein ACFVYA_15035 [Amycolatopsis sp. NPDC058278]|uniref:hypothetical protein n=1 Tax=Amycolatopsis sp. NPDC058278 TaxID=3346417 RepID=UPI0036DB1F0C